jgi:hypothetical protein
MKCILIIGKKTKKKTKIKQNNGKKKFCSISNVGKVQRYQWNLHW